MDVRIQPVAVAQRRAAATAAAFQNIDLRIIKPHKLQILFHGIYLYSVRSWMFHD